MRVEKLKYIIWAQDLQRATRFYRAVFDAEITHQSDVMAELRVGGGTIGIHGGGQGERTWTGLAFQVEDLWAACDQLVAHGGLIPQPPVDRAEEPAHLAMCVDPDGNEIMITKSRVVAAPAA